MPAAKILMDEHFDAFEVGQFSADVGPHTEYHFLRQAAPRHGWSVAAFGSGWESGAGRAWKVVEEGRLKVMCQTHHNDRVHTHPMIATGDDLWADYTVRVDLEPGEAHGRCGVVFRYHNNRCYLFWGFDFSGGSSRLVLLRVRHEKDVHVPDETVLVSAPAAWKAGTWHVATVTVAGRRISAAMAQGGAAPVAVEADDATWPRGKIALLADGLARFHSVAVESGAAEARSIALLRSKRERELDDLRAQQPKPALWKKVSTRGFGVGRNLRFGDLDGDGRMDFAIGQMNAHGPHDAYSEVGCITAMSFDGQVLWQSGEPDPAKTALTNDVAFQIHDVDGDGRAEVVYCRDFEIVIADGATGKVKLKAPTPQSRPPADKFPRILGDCLAFADVRGIGRKGDLVIKDRYWNLWVYDDRLQLLWSGSCRTGHYPWIADVDGDGRDEIAMGYALWDHDGRLLWNFEDRVPDHADGIAIVDLEQKGGEPRILYTASDAGVLLVGLDGRILKHHLVGHAQNPAVGRFRDDIPGLQIVSINFWGNQGILHFWDAQGNLYHDAEPLNMGSMCLPINWRGDGTELFVHNANPTWGGMFDGWARPVVQFPDDGHPDMCNAVLDLTGDCRDEVVVWDPNELWVYTQDDSPKGGRLYKPTRNPLHSASNYQATVSLPGWSG